MARSYRCPLCGSVLKKAVFERVTNIEATRARELHAAHERLREARKQARHARLEGLRAGKAAEKARSDRLSRGLRQKLAVANARIRQMEKGTTPQTEGLEFEDRLYARLKREFPDDKIVLEGKGGDVLHTVLVQRRPVGLILYECKSGVGRIQHAYIEQAMRDKRARQADFALLVTTKTRRGFTGLGREDDVLIVAPLGVVPLAQVLRAQLVEMAKAKLTQGARQKIATAALTYLTSPAFRVPLEEAVSRTTRAQDLLKKEFDQHKHTWLERWRLYQTIDIDLHSIAANVHRILEGGAPVQVAKLKPAPLLLPAVSSAAT